jgi:LytS/YehU family sensor histidine kinase
MIPVIPIEFWMQHSKIASLKIKLIAAASLSVLYTCIFAFIIYGTLNYPTAHLVFDFSYAFVFFLLLYEGYIRIIEWVEKKLSFVGGMYGKYIVGGLIFVLFSLLLMTVVAIIPFLLIFGQTVGAIEFTTEIRLNYTINALVASVYYFFLTSFQALKNFHTVVLDAEKLQKDIAQAQFEALKTQVNPHFLFNSLNVLSSLVHIDADLSEKFIDQLAKAYRYVLEQRDHEMIMLKTEIDFINSFVFLLKIRFEEKLRVNISIPADKLRYYLPPLTLQILIENAVKHNSLSFEHPLVINIFVDEHDYLIVQNNVQLRGQEVVSTGVGLKNITNRYRYLSDQKADFYLSGTTYTAKIPLIRKQ